MRAEQAARELLKEHLEAVVWGGFRPQAWAAACILVGLVATTWPAGCAALLRLLPILD
jgi:hypothetical protein